MLFFGLGLTNVLRLVDIQYAVEMVDLVLKALREESLALQVDLLSVAIQAGDSELAEARYLANVTGDRKAALGHFRLFLREFHFGVDHDGRLAFVVLDVHHEHALGDIDLRRSEADARRGIHRFEHVVDELLEERVGNLFRIDLLRDFAKGRMAVGDDLADIGHGALFYTANRPLMPGIVGSVLAAALDLVAAAFGWHDLRRLTKPLPALILTVVAWRAGGESRRVLAFGLLLAALGDEVLLNSGDIAFMAGMGAFAAMQIAYIVAYLKAGASFKPVTRRAWISLAYAGLALLLFSWLLPKTGSMAAPLVLYAFLLFVMASLALQMPRATAWGGAIFMCSDMILAIVKFQAPMLDPKSAELIVMGSYFTAQVLIVRGMMRAGPIPNAVIAS